MEISKQEIRWVLRAQTGDREALDELFRLVQEPLYRYIVSLTGSRTLAEDILQEVFILIYRNLRWLREPELFRSWAYRIASREAFKHLKRERRWSEQSVDESALEDVPVSPPDTLTPDLIAQLVAQISPASRAVIVLHYLHEMPLGEIADVLGLALGTVKSRLAYGLAGLRKQLSTTTNTGN
ncbi:MAG TPA: RNA polymerase sigma factor [Blastocatellia bacterium]|nr:RNA polymerase sigma factor [Blastocatellia bacterium]HMX26878.1 RNA polymerase sigma factor [Blastocatellia bacterium]HMZ18391.1 RNA polymerase sigma factor [Blastocatellia bacterium]HNG32237.1 RNA polymerase sigma factor [Blastocatellia bacterium]